MKDFNRKPIFEVSKSITPAYVNIGERFSYNISYNGPSDFSRLTVSDFGKGFVMATMPQLIPFIYAVYRNKDDEFARELISKIGGGRNIVGFSSVLWTPDRVYVQDKPILEQTFLKIEDESIISDCKILMSEGTLLNGLKDDVVFGTGSYESDGIVYSKNKKIRSVPWEKIKLGKQSSSDLAENGLVIALANGKEGAELLADIGSRYYKNRICVNGLERNVINEEIITIAGLNFHLPEAGCSFYIKGDISTKTPENFNKGYDIAFGINKSDWYL